jgi:ribosomal protein L13
MSSKRSRVHPKYKTKYRVVNWPAYDRSLVRRGDVTVWLSPAAAASWNAKPSGRRGGQPKYSDLAIETALTLRLVFHLPLRQAEGFLGSLFEIMGIDLETPDHTTLSRRGRQLDVPLCPLATAEPIHLVIDSTGLSIVGEGEWAAVKHGRKGIQGWRKLHLGIDDAGVIVAQVLTDSNLDDATAGVDLIGQVNGSIATVIADAAYDTRPFYNAGSDRGARVVVPPTKRATVTRRRCPARDKTIRRANKIGRRRWKKEAGYHRQARVENAFFRYKSIVGDRLRARDPRGQAVEARLACNALNRMTKIGAPTSIAIRS